MRRVVTLVLFFALVAIVIHSWMTSQLITRETLFPTNVSHSPPPDLERVVDYESISAPWTATLKHIGEEFDVDFQIESSTFEELGIDGTEEVSIRVSNIPLKSLIRHLLRNVDVTLDFFSEDGVIVVTTIDKLEELVDGPNWSKRVYPLADVIESAPQAVTEEELVDLLYMVSPHIWDEMGGSATIQRLPGHMHIHAPQHVHRDVEQLLTGLREQFETVSEPRVRDTTTNERHNKLLGKALSQRVDVDVADQPLDKLLQEWSDRFQVPILIDFVTVADYGLRPDTKLSIAAEQTPFGKVLDRVLNPYDLKYFVDEGVIVIATDDYGWDRLPIKIYPVQDLIDGANLQDDAFEELILDSVLTDEWEELGGPAAMELISGQLVVSHYDLGRSLLHRIPRQYRGVYRYARQAFIDGARCRTRPASRRAHKLGSADLFHSTLSNWAIAKSLPC